MYGQWTHILFRTDLCLHNDTQVSLRLTRLLAKRPNTSIVSIIRDPDQASDIEAAGATPVVLSLEDASVSDFADTFNNAKIDIVYFSAGAGGRAGPERTKKVDEEGAIKVFDAIESVSSNKEERPRLVIVSAVDIRDEAKGYPAHYVRLYISSSLFYHRFLFPL